MTEAEKISKFADALATEWDEFLKNIRKDFSFSMLSLYGFISKLKSHKYENEKKKKALIKDIEKDLEKINLDMVIEMKRRVNVCLAAKSNLKNIQVGG
ncbi:hypothetical protein Hanom_Chr14g01257341 [Helianthus anomalus]